MVGLPGPHGPAAGHGAGRDAADVSGFHLRPGYGSRRGDDLGRGPRTRPGLLHPRPCSGDLLIPQQRHRRPASLGPVRLRSNLHPRLSIRSRRPHHRPHHRQGHGRHPHRPKTGGKKAAQATEQAAARTEAKSVAESQAAHEKSVNAANEVHKQRRYRTKTVSSEHPAESDHALSGWSEERRPTGFQRPNADEVLRVTDEMGYPRTTHPYNQGTPGLYHASHAERQKALTAEWPHLGVSKPMCEDCNGWFRKFAQHQGRDWYVTDPNGVWIFKKDGVVNAPDGRIFNPNEVVPPTYF